MATTTAVDLPKRLDERQRYLRREPSTGLVKSVSYIEMEAASPATSEQTHEDIPNLFVPFPMDPNIPEETHQLTLRALVVGCILGSLVGGSNMYIGLKIGITFGPQLFGAIFGFAILKPLSKVLPSSGIIGAIMGGPFGPKENVTVQSAATAAGGLGILFVTAIPGLYRLGLMSTLAKHDFGKIVALATACGFFGICYAVPFRSYFILKQKLVFPSPTATAITIRSLHTARTGVQIAAKKSMTLLYTLVATFCFRVVSSFAPGMLYDWHIGWSLSRLGWPALIAMENYGWWIEFTPAFFAVGMLSGANASYSLFGGSVMGWAIIAPILVRTGRAVGIQLDPVNFPNIYSYWGLSFTSLDELVNSPSPRYWLLWPGILMMLVASLVELAANVTPIIISWVRSRRRRVRQSSTPPWIDPTPPEDQIPLWWWGTGLILAVILSCSITATQYGVGVGENILALVVACIVAIIGVQSLGATDINPVSVLGKPGQLVLGAVSKGTGANPIDAVQTNIVAGAISSGAAAQAGDMIGDLRTGYLLGARPKAQFIAELVGACVAILLNTGLFILFTTASPCILYPPESGLCTYFVPEASAWAAFATALTSPSLPIPPSSGYTALALAIVAAATVVVKHLFVPQKYWVYVPNWTAVGLGFVTPQVFIIFTMAVGATFNMFWAKRFPKTYDMFMFAIAAGFIAGEGLGGVFNALLAIVKADGSLHGTAIGCPMFAYCG